jgi:hypothetical protein
MGPPEGWTPQPPPCGHRGEAARAAGDAGPSAPPLPRLRGEAAGGVGRQPSRTSSPRRGPGGRGPLSWARRRSRRSGTGAGRQTHPVSLGLRGEAAAGVGRQPPRTSSPPRRGPGGETAFVGSAEEPPERHGCGPPDPPRFPRAPRRSRRSGRGCGGVSPQVPLPSPAGGWGLAPGFGKGRGGGKDRARTPRPPPPRGRGTPPTAAQPQPPARQLSLSLAGNPPFAIGPHLPGVTRMIDFPCFTIASRYSSQSG